MGKRNMALDFLRCLGVTLTIFSHLHIQGKSIPEQIASVISRGGWEGVDLFFVLSGYLVSSLIFKELRKEGSFNPYRFLIRRGFKIYPAFYFFLLITWGMTIYFHYNSSGSNFKYYLEAVFFCNYLPNGPIHPWLWSICVEEHFYILLCILFSLLIRYNLLLPKVIVSIYFVFLLIGVMIRIDNLQYPDFNFFRDCARSHLRMDSLFFGVVLSYFYNQDLAMPKRSFLLTGLAILGISLPFIFDISTYRFISVLSLAINPICFGYIMMCILNFRAAWMAPFTYIGRHSYSIYLFHGLCNIISDTHYTGWKYYLSYFLASFLVGIIVSKVVEHTFIALRNRWFPHTIGMVSQGRLPAPADS